MAEEKQKAADAVEEKPLNKDVVQKLYRDQTFCEKLVYIRKNITVEPLLAGLIIPSVISRFAMGNLNLDKACRVNLQFGDEICDALVKKSSNNYSEYEREVQKLISSIDIWKSVIHTALPCLIILFLGAWSDRTGKRKIIIMLPIYGEVLTSINNLINVYFFYEIPVEITVFLETLFFSVTGGWVTMSLGVFSYISDITSEETRTFRVGLVNFCMTAGLPVGMALSGILVAKLGYYAIFSMTAFMFILVLLYGTFVLVDPDKWLQEKGLPPIERDNNTKASFFDLSHVADTIAVAFRSRPFNRKTKVILTLFVVFMLYGPSMSEHGIFYLFVRNKLNWDMVKFGLYVSYSILLHSFGVMFSITILSKKLKVDDFLLCLISVLSKSASATWTAFARTDIEMYFIPVVDLLNATTFTSLRSIISKLVERQEIAKMNSMFSLTETIAALLFQPFYSWLYMNTLHVFPGTVFLFSAIITIPASIILTFFYLQHRKESKSTRKMALEAQEKKDAEVKKSALDLHAVKEKPLTEKEDVSIETKTKL